jgi:hypothetical protein
MLGGGVSVYAGSRAEIFGELNYSRPSLNMSGVQASGNLFETGSGVRVIIPAHSTTVKPYVALVGGWLHASASAMVPTYFGVPIQVSSTSSGGYFGGGLGMELAITHNFGLRPEFRAFREFFGQPNSNDNALLFGIGAYYRFGTK